jgi:hypothetical protein
MEYIGMLKQAAGYLLRILYYWPEDDQVRSKHIAVINNIMYTSCV